jgi:hypothetical protein
MVMDFTSGASNSGNTHNNHAHTSPHTRTHIPSSSSSSSSSSGLSKREQRRLAKRTQQAEAEVALFSDLHPSAHTHAHAHTKDAREEQLWVPVLAKTARLVDDTERSSAILEGQTESLDNMERDAYIQEDLLRTTQRIRNATSFWGRLKNIVSKDVAKPEDYFTRKERSRSRSKSKSGQLGKEKEREGCSTEEDEEEGERERERKERGETQSSAALTIKHLRRVNRNAQEHSQTLETHNAMLDGLHEKLDGNLARTDKVIANLKS